MIKYTFLPLMLVIAGCATTNVDNDYSSTLQELNLVAKASSENMKRLANINSAINSPNLTKEQKQQAAFQSTYTPTGFEKKATFAFVGQAEVAAKALADLAGYEFRQIGSQPKIPIIVNLKSKDETIFSSVQTMSAQLGSKARFSVYPSAKIAELAFLGK